MAKQDRVGDFIQQAEQAQVGLVRELWAWLLHNKKWWLAPVMVLLLFTSSETLIALVDLSASFIAHGK
jgi:Family of unknown function (DUF5989)